MKLNTTTILLGVGGLYLFSKLAPSLKLASVESQAQAAASGNPVATGTASLTSLLSPVSVDSYTLPTLTWDGS